MALTPITFTDKEDRETSPYDEKYIVKAANMNEIRTVVNAIVTALNTYLRQRIVLNITSSDFTGGYYQNSNLVGLTADSDFFVHTNEGSGVLLTEGSGKGYTYNSTLGRLTMPAEKYRITIYKPLS